MKEILKNYKLAAGLILLSAILIFLGYKDDAAYEVSASSNLYRLSGFIFLYLSLFVIAIKKNKTIIANIILLGMLVVLLELVCFILLGQPVRMVKKFELPQAPEDHISRNVGSVPYADSVYHSVKMDGNDTVYDVRYTFDNYSKRVTPDHDSLRQQYALFFGCSFAFGEGLEDNETFGYYVQQVENKANAYNFAYSGYGTNHMLARMEYQFLPDQVKEKTGSAYYIFIWDHMYRALGTMARYTDWLYNAPYYKFENGELVRDKMFKDGRKRISGCYEWLFQTSIVRYFQIDLPPRLFDYHYNLVTEMIKKSETTYKKQFGNDNFYVVLYPSYDICTQEEYDRFKFFLDKKNIRYVDLTNFIKYGKEYSIHGDQHPTAGTNKMLVIETLKRLGKFQSPE